MSSTDDDLDVDHVDHSDETYDADEFDAASMMSGGDDGGAGEAIAADDGDEDSQTDTTRDEFEAAVTSHEGIDWAALFTEFGLNTPDAVGHCFASQTQLQAAVECSEQDIGGDAQTHIDDAVDAGEIQAIEADGAVVGYQHEVCRQ